MGWLGLCSMSPHSTNEADIISNISNHQGREKELWKGLNTAIKYPDMARVTSTYNSLARINNQASPNHKRAKKYNSSMCSAGA